MKKGLIYILLTMLGFSGLPISSESHAGYSSIKANEYITNPVTNESDAPVYPNPATDHIFVRLDKVDPFMSNGSVEFEIRSILGNSMPVNSEKTDTFSYRIDTSDYPAGYYLLVVRCVDCEAQSNSARGKVFKFLKK